MTRGWRRRTEMLGIGAAVVAGALAGCGGQPGPAASSPAADGASSPATGPTNGAAGKLDVSASFYPLQWLTQRVGGDRVEVRNLAKPGAEPHDLELDAQDVRALGTADLVVYLEGFQPAVDDAVRQAAAGTALDATDAARLDRSYVPLEDAHAQQGHAEGTQTDPHFWLDPTRAAAVGDAIAERLAAVDAPGATAYRANAAALRSDLTALDAQFRAGTSSCTSRSLVTSHDAFGYLAARYGLKQVGIAGLSPEDEPSPRELAEAAEFVKANAVRTIYYETLVSPDVAATLAEETGARTGVLDPIEGLTDASPGRDYLEIMRSNLASIRAGQPCP